MRKMTEGCKHFSDTAAVANCNGLDGAAAGPQCLGMDSGSPIHNDTSLSIAWWNTSRNPPRSRKVHATATRIYPVVEKLCGECDIVFLGEYRREKRLEKLIARVSRRTGKDLSIISKSEKTERQFCVTCVFDANKLFFGAQEGLEDICDLFVDNGTDFYRVGQKFSFISDLIEKRSVSFYVSHWSQYSETDSHEIKIIAACQLRTHIRNSACYNICLGDYNQEPYGAAMSTLGSSRSADFVRRRGGFYNPFWRHMHDNLGTLHSENRRILRTGDPLFDQIMVGERFVLEDYRFQSEICDSSYIDPKDGEHRPIKLEIRR